MLRNLILVILAAFFFLVSASIEEQHMNKRQKVEAYLVTANRLEAKKEAKAEMMKPFDNQIKKLKQDLEQAKIDILCDADLRAVMESTNICNDFGQVIMLQGDELVIQQQSKPESIHLLELDEEL